MAWHKSALHWCLVIVILFSSCATTLNRKAYLVKFSSSGDGDKIEVNKKTYELPARVSIRRSKEDLDVKLITDTVTADYTIRSAPNPQFLFYNLLWFSVAPA